MRRAGIALALLLSASAVSATTFYWGPVKGTVASPALAGVPTNYFLQYVYPHPVAQVDVLAACNLIVNTYGQTIGDPYVEAPSNLVYGAFIDNYTGPDRWRNIDSPTCFNLLHEGICLLLDGHVTAYPDRFGQRWIVDHIAAATCP